MGGIDTTSRICIELTLTWQSDTASHTEKLWADPVNFWRDVLDPCLVAGLLGCDVGAQAAVDIPAATFLAPYDQRKRVRIRPDQFCRTDSRGNPQLPVPGRYYPQGLLRGVSGAYSGSSTPCRCLGTDGDRLVFDLNHPLAGRDLRLQAKVMALHQQYKERGGRCEHWLERVCADGPGMQARCSGAERALFADENFFRLDERPDSHFYQRPRMVHHLDRLAREEISRRYGELIADGARVLDLMGSWDSHLPEHRSLENLTVLGLNEEELANNSRADKVVVQDLNTQSRLPFADASFDAVICTASVEYLTRPLAVLLELARVLRSGGLAAFAFSNRWFPPKVIRIWPDLHEFERMGMVAELLHATPGLADIATLSRRGLPRPPDDPHTELWLSDPIFMVWGRKQD